MSRAWVLILVLLSAAPPAPAQGAPSEPPELAPLRELFVLPDKDIDLGQAKLLIDHVIDPSVNVSVRLAQLDAMAAEIRAALPPGATSFDRAQYLRGYLYALGPWSGQTPFQYDLSDPHGNVFEHRLLHDYMDSRKGNCITMPLLFLILGQRLGLDVNLSTAPQHLFVKFTDPASGSTFNIEATDGGLAAEDEFYVEKMEISKQALEERVYLQALTAKEAVATMMTVLCEHYEKQKEWERSRVVAEVVLDHYPKSVYAMVKMGNSYAGLMDETRRRAALGLSDSQMEELRYLSKQNEYWFTKAEELGWHEPSEAQELAYIASVRKRQEELH